LLVTVPDVDKLRIPLVKSFAEIIFTTPAV